MRKTRAFLVAFTALSVVVAPLGEALAQKLPGRIDGGVNSPKPVRGPSVKPPKVGRGDMPRGGHGGHGGHGMGGRGWGGVAVGIATGLAVGALLSQPAAAAPPPGNPAPRSNNQSRNNSRGGSGVPAAGETRMVPDEVVIELPNTTSAQVIDAIRQRQRLTQLDSQSFALTGTTFYRWRIPDRRSVPAVVRALEGDTRIATAQPNYLFTLQQDAAKPTTEATARPSDIKPDGVQDTTKLQGAEIKAKYDPAQYAVGKMRLPEAHGLAKGDDVLVAVIDSGVDVTHPELAGAVVGSLDTLKPPFAAHDHGTAIAALIAGRERLTGSSPAARILAVRAFDPAGGGAEGTTFNIMKGLDWSAARGARVINMSFAGPADPAIARSLAAARKKGIVLVAAAGNAGAKSPPLYPAADPNVIAVTATDSADRLFDGSNRGHHIAVAAPGVDVLIAVPNGGYQVSTGTSYSAAEVSGIVALMLQYKGTLSPDQVRDILTSSAKDLGPPGRDDDFGAGLTDAYGALMQGAKTSAATPAR